MDSIILRMISCMAHKLFPEQPVQLRARLCVLLDSVQCSMLVDTRHVNYVQLVSKSAPRVCQCFLV